MKPFKTFLSFAFVFFCFVSFAHAQTAVLTNGTFSITANFPPNPTTTGWTIGGADFFSNLPPNEVQVIQPTIKRAGTTVEAYTLSYAPLSTARGNVINGATTWVNIYYRSNSNSLNRTVFNFNFPAHALPKFTPNRNDIFIDLPFTMETTFAGYNNPESPHLLFTREVTGSGIAHLNYIRVPNSVRARRSLPTPDVWLAYVLFDFDAPAVSNGD
jgi:hypothetical protein